MSHDELTDLLESLPHQTASRDFTARTLARVGQRRRPRPHLRNAFAIVLSAIVLLSGAIGVRQHERKVRLHQLRVEQQQIQKELEELKALSSAREPRVFVGSSGSYDFVVGLKERSRTTSAPRPVSLHIANDAVF